VEQTLTLTIDRNDTTIERIYINLKMKQ